MDHDELQGSLLPVLRVDLSLVCLFDRDDDDVSNEQPASLCDEMGSI